MKNLFNTPANTGNNETWLIRFNEQVVSGFIIPAFTLKRGEIVIVQYPSGSLFSKREALIDLLTGRTNNAETEITTLLRYAVHIQRRSFRNLLAPNTVRGYLKKFANASHPLYNRIYGDKWIKPTTRLDELGGASRRLLSIYATLTWTNNILFDLAGVDPAGGEQVFEVVAGVVRAGGACILLDICDEFKEECTTIIEARYVGVL